MDTRFFVEKGIRQVVPLERPHQPHAAGAGIGAEAAGNALFIVGNIPVIFFPELFAGD
ncbi:MAG: hypothetical protein LiPW30_778, partial [Parcubacteria group bacterium LiPW_30]